jgi:glycerol-3-phosphate acyltransferase PlsY
VSSRITTLLAAASAGYLLGTFPSADLAARAAGASDLRTQGTGNPGAANAIGVLGAGWGYSVLGADVAKGALACGVGRRIGGDDAGHLAGTLAVIGHCYPVWNGFKGGKGVAASAGQALGSFPAYFMPDLALAGVISVMPWWKQRASMAAKVSAVAWTIAAFVWWRKGWSNLWGPEPSAALPLAAAATSGVIIVRFRHANRPPKQP